MVGGDFRILISKVVLVPNLYGDHNVLIYQIVYNLATKHLNLKITKEILYQLFRSSKYKRISIYL